MILRHFWFVGAAVMLLNIAIAWPRFRDLAARGIITADEATRCIRILAIVFVGSPLLMGILALVANWPSPFCAGILAFGTPLQSAASIIALATWGSVLWWVWRGDGAELLGRIVPALADQRPFDKGYSPARVRLVVTAFVLLSGIGGAIMWRAMPVPPELTCPASP